ncbi:MAG: hypothetical protein ABR608_15660 [Pseudonocardiaceae bacterium]
MHLFRASTSWADRLELVGGDDRLVGFVGVLPLRLLAERIDLRAGISAVLRRPGFDPVYDRGQVLIVYRSRTLRVSLTCM